LKNNFAKFHPDLILKDGAIGFLKTVVPTTTRRATSSDMGSVPDPRGSVPDPRIA